MNRKWTLAAVILIGLMATLSTGCVSSAEFEKAKAASRRAHEELQKAQQALLELRQENEQLKRELAARQAELAAKDKIIENLQRENSLLSQELAKLKDLYGKALGKEPPIMPQGMALPQGLNDLLAKLAAEHPDLFEYFPELGMLKLKADLTFDPGSITIKPDAVNALKELSKIMNTPDAATFSMYIAGHTDDIPVSKKETKDKYGNNWGLSVHRSLSVIETLFNGGVSQNRLGAMGFSKYHPIAPNAAANKGNSANRRVEIWIVPPEKLFTTDKMGSSTNSEVPPAGKVKAAAPKAAAEPKAVEEGE